MNFDFSTKGIEKHAAWPGPYAAVNVGLPWGGPGRFVWHSHHHDALELVSIPNGVRGHIIVNGCSYPIDRPNFLSFPAGHIHSYDLRFEGRPLFAILLVHPAFLVRLLSLYRNLSKEDVDRGTNSLSYEHKTEAASLNELVLKLSHVKGWLRGDAPDVNPVATAICDQQILISIVAKLFSAESMPREDVRENTPVKRAIAAIEKNFQDRLTLETIARDSSTSKYHLCRLFKAQTGTSLWTFVNSVRIRHAVELLAQGDMNVTEVCFECGFSDPSYFAKVYKRHTGINPKKRAAAAPEPRPRVRPKRPAIT